MKNDAMEKVDETTMQGLREMGAFGLQVSSWSPGIEYTKPCTMLGCIVQSQLLNAVCQIRKTAPQYNHMKSFLRLPIGISESLQDSHERFHGAAK